MTHILLYTMDHMIVVFYWFSTALPTIAKENFLPLIDVTLLDTLFATLE